MRISGIWQSVWSLHMSRLDHTDNQSDWGREGGWRDISGINTRSQTSTLPRFVTLLCPAIHIHTFSTLALNSKRYWSFFLFICYELWKDVLSHSYSNTLLNREFVFRCFEMLLRFINLCSRVYPVPCTTPVCLYNILRIRQKADKLTEALLLWVWNHLMTL